MKKNKDVEVDENLVDDKVEVNNEEKAEATVEETLQQEVNLLKDKLLRNTAELENFKRRTNDEKQTFMKYAVSGVMLELIDIVDNFERALDSMSSLEEESLVGVKMIYNQLNTVLTANGVEVIEAIGKDFDPNIHQAVMTGKDENYGSQIVIEELQRGYMFKDKVLRPSMVKVNE